MRNLVIKVGGSLLYDDNLELNTDFLNLLKNWYQKHSESIQKLVIVVGGGKLSRKLGKALIDTVSSENVHDVSMQVTQVNAEIVKGYLNISDAFVPQHLNEALDELQRDKKSVIVTGGLKSGWSTDMDAAVFADSLGIKTIYKLSNIDGVYTSDPKANPDAKKITNITWNEYLEVFNINVNETHAPNNSSPISVETVIFCKNKNITYFVSGGKNLLNQTDLSLVFESGTKISPN
jgi:uridylate kinase